MIHLRNRKFDTQKRIFCGNIASTVGDVPTPWNPLDLSMGRSQFCQFIYLTTLVILGDIQTGILVGAAMQIVYIALVTPGGTVSADVRAVSYIGIPLAMVALKSYGLAALSVEGAALATSFGTMVGTLGTVLFYGTATANLAWQHIGWKAVEKGEFRKLYAVNMGLPWISHFFFSFIPTLIMCKLGADVVELIK